MPSNHFIHYFYYICICYDTLQEWILFVNSWLLSRSCKCTLLNVFFSIVGVRILLLLFNLLLRSFVFELTRLSVLISFIINLVRLLIVVIFLRFSHHILFFFILIIYFLDSPSIWWKRRGRYQWCWCWLAI